MSLIKNIKKFGTLKWLLPIVFGFFIETGSNIPLKIIRIVMWFGIVFYYYEIDKQIKNEINKELKKAKD